MKHLSMGWLEERKYPEHTHTFSMSGGMHSCGKMTQTSNGATHGKELKSSR